MLKQQYTVHIANLRKENVLAISYSSIHTPCPCFWPSRHNFRDSERKFGIVLSFPYY